MEFKFEFNPYEIRILLLDVKFSSCQVKFVLGIRLIFEKLNNLNRNNDTNILTSSKSNKSLTILLLFTKFNWKPIQKKNYYQNIQYGDQPEIITNKLDRRDIAST